MVLYSNISTSTFDLNYSIITSIEGVILTTSNTLLALFIVFSQQFRSQKEYIIFLGSMIYDSIFGVAFFSGGIAKIVMFYTEKFIPLSTPWGCFNTVQVYTGIIGIPACGCISFLSAVDRFISLMYPIKYRNLTTKYSKFMISIPFLLAIPMYLVSGIECFGDRDNYKIASCGLNSVGMPIWLSYLRTLRICFTILAVLLYIPITWKIRRIIKTKKENSSNLNIKQRQNLIRATVMVGILVANESILFLFADIYLYIYPNSSIAFLFNASVITKGVINVFLFLFIQKELRKAMILMIRRLIPLSIWTTNQTTTNISMATVKKVIHKSTNRIHLK